MNWLLQKLSLLCLILPAVYTVDEDAHLSNLLNAVKNALYSSATLENLHRRPQDYHHSSSNGISLGVYEALLSITRNDDLECVPRLLCEAAAGGQPGYSGRDIKFDKTSLMKFISYLNFGSTKTSPLLTFAKAALLGVSNRGDPYSCIINYSKCPRDQSRLLHYLNNHRGGFFQYFDRDDHHNSYYRPSTHHYNQYGGGYRDEYRPVKYKKNQITFDGSGFYNGLKKKVKSEKGGFYAKKYPYLAFRFPHESTVPSESNDHRKRMIFPEEADTERVGDPRIVNQVRKGKFAFEEQSKGEKTRADSSFFPEANDSNYDSRTEEVGGGLATDRLPPRFHFPLTNEGDAFYNIKSFFPIK